MSSIETMSTGSSILQITLKTLDDDGTSMKIFSSQRAQLSQQIKAMMQKEAMYKCSDSDYYNDNNNNNEPQMMMHKKYYQYQYHNENGPNKRRRVGERKIFMANDTSRQEMCEWSCRIVDYFGGNRELVAIAQNYLDRFLGKYRCDCMGYKLAAMTSLCLAVKVHNKKPISMKSLSKLSSGAVTIQEMTEMEYIVLKALDWNLCPPTASNFCTYFHTLLPECYASSSSTTTSGSNDNNMNTKATVSVRVRQSILERSYFFAELSLFEYSLSLFDQSEIAFASILNSLQYLEKQNLENNFVEEGTSSLTFTLPPNKKWRQEFVENIEFYSGLDSTSQRIRRARNKLWALYRRSKEYHDSTSFKQQQQGISIVSDASSEASAEK